MGTVSRDSYRFGHHAGPVSSPPADRRRCAMRLGRADRTFRRSAARPPRAGEVAGRVLRGSGMVLARRGVRGDVRAEADVRGGLSRPTPGWFLVAPSSGSRPTRS